MEKISKDFVLRCKGFLYNYLQIYFQRYNGEAQCPFALVYLYCSATTQPPTAIPTKPLPSHFHSYQAQVALNHHCTL